MLTGLAASVAYSRVYLGVHYPSDVLAGAALGAAFGATARSGARKLGLGVDGREAAKLLATGEVSRVDLGRLARAGQPSAYFAHAATVGLNVNFSKLATRTSVRARVGRLTYLISAVYVIAST